MNEYIMRCTRTHYGMRDFRFEQHIIAPNEVAAAAIAIESINKAIDKSVESLNSFLDTPRYASGYYNPFHGVACVINNKSDGSAAFYQTYKDIDILLHEEDVNKAPSVPDLFLNATVEYI